MSVLVRGMEMPNTCRECIIGNPKNKTCYILGLPKRNLELREDCPLIEVSPHGRLIDADFEERHYTSMTVNPTPDVTKQDKRNSLIIIEALQMAKTIIEAEGSET